MLLAAERKDGVLAAIESKQIMRSRPRERRLVPQPTRREPAGARCRHRTPPGQRRALLRREGRLQGAVRALVNPHPGSPPCREPLPSTLWPRARAPTSSTPSASPPGGRRPPRPRRRSMPRGARSARSTTRPRKRSEEAFHDWGLHADPNVDLAKELLENVTKESSMITAARTPGQGVRALRRGLPARRGRPADRRVGALR